MSDGTHIEWTDATWNVVNGCSVLTPGCTNCYAMRLAGTRLKHHPSREGLTIDTKAGPVWTGEVRFNEAVLLDPLKWRRPRKIFVCAHGDLFHDNVPDEWIDKVFAVMALCPHHVFQVLTKRPERLRAYLQAQTTGQRHVTDHVDIWESQGLVPKHINTFRGWIGSPDRPRLLPNVWLGVSVEDQKRADERIPILLATPAAVRWLSCEPLLGPIEWNDEWRQQAHGLSGSFRSSFAGIDWIVAGGESGPGARPMHPDWARSLRDWCAADGVPFLFKQWGEWHPADQTATREQLHAYGDMGHALRDGRAREFDDQWTWHIGKKLAGRLLDGIQHDGYPGQPLGQSTTLAETP